MSKVRRRERQRLGNCTVTGSLSLEDDPFDMITVTLSCVRTAGHRGRHQDLNFGPWSEA